jgi:hypothetical protein
MRLVSKTAAGEHPGSGGTSLPALGQEFEVGEDVGAELIAAGLAEEPGKGRPRKVAKGDE